MFGPLAAAAITGGIGLLGKQFGGGSQQGYMSPNVGKYEDQVNDLIKRRIRNPYTGRAAVNDVSSAYDLSPIDDALSGFRRGAGISTRPSLYGAGYGNYNGVGYNDEIPDWAQETTPQETQDPNSLHFDPDLTSLAITNPQKAVFQQYAREHQRNNSSWYPQAQQKNSTTTSQSLNTLKQRPSLYRTFTPQQGNTGYQQSPNQSLSNGQDSTFRNYRMREQGNPNWQRTITEQPDNGAYKPFHQTYQSTYRPSTYESSYTPKAYNPAQFNFAQLPDQYSQIAYNQGSKNIRRESAGNLAQLREATGTRRPGLFTTQGQQAQRNEQEQLGNLAAQTELERMRQNVEIGKQQQLEQAGENYRGAQFGDEQARAANAARLASAQFNEANRQFGAGEAYEGYESRSNLEKANADEVYRNLQALAGLGQNKAEFQRGALAQERAYRDQPIGYMQDLYHTSTGTQANASRGNGFGDIASLGQAIGTTWPKQSSGTPLSTQGAEGGAGTFGGAAGRLSLARRYSLAKRPSLYS